MRQSLLDMAYWLYPWAFRPIRSSDPRPLFFLVIGNGRTGSTWLQTTFDQLPDVLTRLELKLRLPYQEPHPLHVYVDQSTVSIEDCILQACGIDSGSTLEPLSYGSKLIFDPYGYLDPGIFDRLGEILDKNIRTILLKRSYAAQFTSWKLRGVYHELNVNSLGEGASVDQRLVDVVKSWKQPELKTMLFTLNGGPLLGADPTSVGNAAIHYPAEDAVEDLLVLFYNDLKALAFAQRQNSYAVVDYDEIGEKFFDLARMIGSEATAAEIRHALGHPITRRLQTLEPERMQPPGFLPRLSACLDRAFVRAVNYHTAEAIWHWSRDRKFVDLKVEGLAEILSDYGVPHETRSSSATSPDDLQVCWRRRRPIYKLV